MKFLLDTSTHRLTFKFYNESRSLVEVTSPLLRIYNPANALAISGQSLSSLSTGIYYYDLATSGLGTTYGTYMAFAEGIYNSTTIFADSPEVLNYHPKTESHIYISASEFRLDNNIADAQDNRIILDVLYAATDFVNSYCGRKFHLYTVSNEKHTLDYDEYVFLRNFPIDSISSLIIEDSEFSSTSYTLDETTGRIKFDFSHTGNMLVTYVAGTRSIPNDIHFACKKIASYLWNRRLNEGLSSERLFSYSYTLESDVFKEVKTLLDNHKHVRL